MFCFSSKILLFVLDLFDLVVVGLIGVVDALQFGGAKALRGFGVFVKIFYTFFYGFLFIFFKYLTRKLLEIWRKLTTSAGLNLIVFTLF